MQKNLVMIWTLIIKRQKELIRFFKAAIIFQRKLKTTNLINQLSLSADEKRKAQNYANYLLSIPRDPKNGFQGFTNSVGYLIEKTPFGCT